MLSEKNFLIYVSIDKKQLAETQNLVSEKYGLFYFIYSLLGENWRQWFEILKNFKLEAFNTSTPLENQRKGIFQSSEKC